MTFPRLTANIYLPSLEKEYQTSLQLTNLTITAYIIVQGIVPAFFGELSDKIGRRPVYLISFTVYVIASVGLALQHSYAALLTPAGVAVMKSLLAGLRPGPFLTLLAGLASMICIIAITVVRHKGIMWRLARRERYLQAQEK